VLVGRWVSSNLVCLASGASFASEMSQTQAER
jgi:hypothetical protein